MLLAAAGESRKRWERGRDCWCASSSSSSSSSSELLWGIRSLVGPIRGWARSVVCLGESRGEVSGCSIPSKRTGHKARLLLGRKNEDTTKPPSGHTPSNLLSRFRWTGSPSLVSTPPFRQPQKRASGCSPCTCLAQPVVERVGSGE